MDKKLINFLADNFALFIKENPSILKSMVGGYKAQFFLSETSNKKELKINCSVISSDGNEMTLEELFNMKTLTY